MMGVKGLNDSVLSIVGIFVPINIQMHALWLVEDCFISRHNHLARGDYGEVITTGALFFFIIEMADSCLVSVNEELMKRKLNSEEHKRC